MKKETLLVTGLSGFVGTNLSRYLKEEFDITGISRTPTPQSIGYDDFFAMENNTASIVHLAGKAHDLKKTAGSAAYFEANYDLTKKLYDAFLRSGAKKFIYVSSVKAVKDTVEGELTEDVVADPVTAYGKSKHEAENYILANLRADKNVYILRPCMIHGPGNKGNLNLLYGVVSKGIPYPLAAFENQRSFLSVDNLCFVIEQLLLKDITSGVFNVADDTTLSTNEVIALIAKSLGKKPQLWKIPKFAVTIAARIGSFMRLPLNSERLAKLTENFVVSNKKITEAIGPLPLAAEEGLRRTLLTFKKTDK
jgi:nucleoside-diphosphate-sugar epimerase